MKKILFLSNQLPHNSDGGGILYSDIIKKYGAEKFFFLSLVQPIKLKDFNIESKRIINQYSLKLPRTNTAWKILSKLPLIETIYTYINLLKSRGEICHYITNKNFDAIYAPLRGEVLLLLPYILKKTQLPFYAMVEDTVEAEIKDPYFIYAEKKKNYYELLSSVKSLGVAGETMKGYFKNSFNINSTILRSSHEKFTESYPKSIDKVFNVFFAGNTYAENELAIFIKALEIFALNSNTTVNFYLASHTSFSSNSKKLTINNLGWLTHKQLMECMDKCHIAYLPYRSEPKFKHQMKYAFPGKSTFYISNNLPIFFHGPTYSSFNAFLKKYKVGESCNSLDPDVLSSVLAKFLSNPSFYLNCQKECKRTFNEEFSNEVFSERVEKFFDTVRKDNG